MGAAVAVTIIMFLVVSVIVAGVLVLVYYWRKNRLSCLKGRKRILAIGECIANAWYFICAAAKWRTKTREKCRLFSLYINILIPFLASSKYRPKIIDSS